MKHTSASFGKWITALLAPAGLAWVGYNLFWETFYPETEGNTYLTIAAGLFCSSFFLLGIMLPGLLLDKPKHPVLKKLTSFCSYFGAFTGFSAFGASLIMCGIHFLFLAEDVGLDAQLFGVFALLFGGADVYYVFLFTRVFTYEFFHDFIHRPR